MIYIDWYVKTSSQQKNKMYSCQSFLSLPDCNSSTAQANCITTTKDKPAPYPVYNRGEWMNHQLTAEEEIMKRVKFFFKFMYLTQILCIWFKSKVISALELHSWCTMPNIATVETEQPMDQSWNTVVYGPKWK